MKHERFCCDGGCTQGRGHCPAISPGVVQHHPRRARGGALWRLLRPVLRQLGAAVVWLFTGRCV